MRSLIRRTIAGFVGRGHKRWMLPFTRIARVLKPFDTPIAEFHGKMLIASPATSTQVEEAIDVLTSSLRRQPTQRGGTVLADAILVLTDSGAPGDVVRSKIASFADIEIGLAFPGLQSLATGLIDRGLEGAADALDLMERAVDHRGAVEFAHTSAVRLGDFERAELIAEKARGCRWMTDSVHAGLAAERSLAAVDPVGALELLDAVKPERTSAFSRRFVGAAAAAGEYERVQDYLETTVHKLPLQAESQFAFEAHWALGNGEAASAALDAALKKSPLDPLLLRLAHQSLTRTADDATDQMIRHVRQLEDELEEPSLADITALMASYFEFESLDDIERLAASTPDKLFGSASRVHLARTRYVLRDFDGAIDALRPL
ncbi:hypothetical protein OAV19_00720, partial [bacterium]|nr:hypothetical protein [bacterium]